MKRQYAHCCFIDLINYNGRCSSGTRQTSLSHQSVTRDDIADIIAHLVLIASTHCMYLLGTPQDISFLLFSAMHFFKVRKIINYIPTHLKTKVG
jgi:hypothetical protein